MGAEEDPVIGFSSSSTLAGIPGCNDVLEIQRGIIISPDGSLLHNHIRGIALKFIDQVGGTLCMGRCVWHPGPNANCALTDSYAVSLLKLGILTDGFFAGASCCSVVGRAGGLQLAAKRMVNMIRMKYFIGY